MRSVTNCLRRNERDLSYIERSLGFKEEEVVIRKREKEKKGREARHYIEEQT